jgi:4-hydroxy-tetrahydrodipicolinate synthase
MTKTLSLRGLIPAFPTAIDASGLVDKSAMINLVRYMIAEGVNGVVPIGGTGEYTSLARHKRTIALEATVEASNGAVPVVAGVLDPGLGDAIDSGLDFKKVGADALMVIAPYYVRASQQGVIDYFHKFRDSVDLPIVLYDNPFRSNIVLSPETIATLANDGTVVGMKASNTDLYHFDQVMQRVTPDFQMLSGQDTLFAQQVSQGARGGVLTSAALVPAVWNKIQALAEDGNFKDAIGLQRKLSPLMDTLFSEQFPEAVRLAFEMIGLRNGTSLLPVSKVSDSLAARLLGVLKDLYAQGLLSVEPSAVV